MARDAEARMLARYGRRTYTRDGWRYQIRSIEAVDNRLLIEADFTDIATGRVIRVAKDQPAPFNGIRLTNPGTQVPDGEEPNPNYNAADMYSRPTRTRFRDDYIEALKIHLERIRDMAVREAERRG